MKTKELSEALEKIFKIVSKDMREYGELRGLVQCLSIQPDLIKNEEFKKVLEIYASE